MKTKIVIVAVIFLIAQVRSQSYEGEIGNAYSVWFDLDIPSSDGPVKGTYFYKKYGEDIQVSGNKIGKTLSMKETGKNGSVSGVIECDVKDDSVVGTWKKPGGRKSLALKLKKTDINLKKYAKVMSGRELQLARGETEPQTGKVATLAAELMCSGCVTEEGNPLKGPADLEVYYAKNDIFSTSFHWGYYGAYYTGGNNYHTFDLITKKEIVIWDEIDEKKIKDFNKYLNNQITPILVETRKEYPDSEWAEVFDTWLHDNESGIIRDSVGDFFKIDDIRKDCMNSNLTHGTNFYIDSISLHFLITDYFDLPHAIQAMDAYGDVVIPFPELKKYLKTESVLRKLLQTNSPE